MVLDLMDMDFFSRPSCGTDRDVIIFGVDTSSFTMIENRKKHISILGKGTTHGLEHALPAEKIYSINLLKIMKNFV